MAATRPLQPPTSSGVPRYGSASRSRAELDEPLDRLDAVALRRPHERLVEDLLRIVGRLPGRESRRAGGRSRGARPPRACRRARRSGRPARARPRRAGCAARARADRRPRDDPRRAPTTSGVPPSPRAERSVRAPAASSSSASSRSFAVAGLVELRPAVVVAAVHVGAALQEQPNDARGRPPCRSRSLPFVPRCRTSSGMLVEQRTQPLEIVVLDRAIGEHERRRRLLAARKRLHAACQLRPAREPVPLREVAARVRERDAVHRRDPVRASLVVLEIRVERLLGDFVHERGPAGVPCSRASTSCALARRGGRSPRRASGRRLPRARGTRELLGLLAKLFEIHHDLLPFGPAVRGVGREEDRLVLPGRS